MLKPYKTELHNALRKTINTVYKMSVRRIVQSNVSILLCKDNKTDCTSTHEEMKLESIMHYS